MHADEDVGKIAMAVPLLVSKALELFLQDLCDRTYEITLMKGAKTMNSSHLEIIGKVPDLGGLDAAGEELNVPKKRKVDDDDEPKKSRMHETFHVTSCGRGRGCCRGRGNRTAGRENAAHHGKFEDDPDISCFEEEHTLSFDRQSPTDVVGSDELKKHNPTGKNFEAPVLNIDLNADLDENGDSIASKSNC